MKKQVREASPLLKSKDKKSTSAATRQAPNSALTELFTFRNGDDPAVAALEALDGRERGLPEDIGEQILGRLGLYRNSVHIYEDEGLAELGQRAYARGNEIHVARGAFDPHSASGQALLAHEAAHIVQQGSGLARGHGLLESSALEQQADALPPIGAEPIIPVPAAAAPIQGWNPFTKLKNLLKKDQPADAAPQAAGPSPAPTAQEPDDRGFLLRQYDRFWDWREESKMDTKARKRAGEETTMDKISAGASGLIGKAGRGVLSLAQKTGGAVNKFSNWLGGTAVGKAASGAMSRVANSEFGQAVGTGIRTLTNGAKGIRTSIGRKGAEIANATGIPLWIERKKEELEEHDFYRHVKLMERRGDADYLERIMEEMCRHKETYGEDIDELSDDVGLNATVPFGNTTAGSQSDMKVASPVSGAEAAAAYTNMETARGYGRQGMEKLGIETQDRLAPFNTALKLGAQVDAYDKSKKVGNAEDQSANAFDAAQTVFGVASGKATDYLPAAIKGTVKMPLGVFSDAMSTAGNLSRLGKSTEREKGLRALTDDELGGGAAPSGAEEQKRLRAMQAFRDNAAGQLQIDEVKQFSAATKSALSTGGKLLSLLNPVAGTVTSAFSSMIGGFTSWQTGKMERAENKRLARQGMYGGRDASQSAQEVYKSTKARAGLDRRGMEMAELMARKAACTSSLADRYRMRSACAVYQDRAAPGSGADHMLTRLGYTDASKREAISEEDLFRLQGGKNADMRAGYKDRLLRRRTP